MTAQNLARKADAEKRRALVPQHCARAGPERGPLHCLQGSARLGSAAAVARKRYEGRTGGARGSERREHGPPLRCKYHPGCGRTADLAQSGQTRRQPLRGSSHAVTARPREGSFTVKTGSDERKRDTRYKTGDMRARRRGCRQHGADGRSTLSGLSHHLKHAIRPKVILGAGSPTAKQGREAVKNYSFVEIVTWPGSVLNLRISSIYDFSSMNTARPDPFSSRRD